MDDLNIKYYQELATLYSKDELKTFDSPITQFNSQIPLGDVAEIGFGMGHGAVYFASQNRNVTCFDAYQSTFDLLVEKFANEPFIGNLNFSLMDNLPILGDKKYAVIVLENILHFYKPSDVRKFCNNIIKNLVSGGLISVINHHVDGDVGKKYKNPFDNNMLFSCFSTDRIKNIFLDSIENTGYEKEHQAWINVIEREFDEPRKSKHIQNMNRVQKHVYQRAIFSKGGP